MKPHRICYGLALFFAGICVGLWFAGCSSKPDPRDPAIYRPTAPIVYPQPR